MWTVVLMATVAGIPLPIMDVVLLYEAAHPTLGLPDIGGEVSEEEDDEPIVDDVEEPIVVNDDGGHAGDAVQWLW